MFRHFTQLLEPLRLPMVYRKRLGSGRTVSVFVSDECLELNKLVIRFERKIEASDVVAGKLVPVTLERVKRRGGKRRTSLALSYESAEALQLALKGALKDARKRRFWHNLSNRLMFSSFFELSEE